jgi:asparagine synthase (glutamine-hydrolysing)
VWDRQDRELTLARDRIGEKPLYYGWVGSVFVFGSELKALRLHPDWDARIDRVAVQAYLTYNYVPAPRTIYQGIAKLTPGTHVTLGARSELGANVVPVPYWSALEVATAGMERLFRGSDAEAADELDRLLRESVRGQMLADVNVGAFLSGGIDSSTIVALMQQEAPQKIRTFTIGSPDAGYDESSHAGAVARYLGTDHVSLSVSASEAQAVIPALPTLYDEPFADSSQIPTYLVSQLARQHVAVCLSGDAADELFGGYHRYYLGNRLWKTAKSFPSPVRKLVSRVLTSLSPTSWDRLVRELTPVLPRWALQRQAGDKIHKLAAAVDIHDPAEFYTNMVSHWKYPEEVADGAPEQRTPAADWQGRTRLVDFRQEMMYLDLVTYLPDDLLVKVDRASMGMSLECRIPFLDHRVIEFAWRLPLSMKFRARQSKWLLRQVLYKYTASFVGTAKDGLRRSGGQLVTRRFAGVGGGLTFGGAHSP